MKRLKWRGCSALLALCMVLPLVPANAWAAAGTIPVRSKSLEVPLFNKQTYLNNAFKEETLYGVQNTKQMNAGKGFVLFSTKGCENDPAANFYDNFGVLLEHDWDYGWWVAHYKWDTNTAPVFRELLQQGELSAEISAIMCYDEHRFLFRHGTAKDHAYFGLRHSSQVNTSAYIKYIQTSDSAGDEVMKRYGNNSWVALPYKANDSELYLRLNHTYCECGSSKITNGTVAFADTAGPGVPKVSVTTSGGSGRYFSSGTIDITLTFDEYIRLANPNAAISQNNALKYGLNLLAYDRRTNVSTPLTARLAEIGEKTMRFQYTIPENEDLDVVITGISSNQPFFSNADLYMYTSNGRYESFPGFNLQTSLICDLAGNRLNDRWNTNILFPENQQFYVDTIAPQYASSALQGNMISSGTTPGDPEAGTWPEGADRSQVFAGVGDWLQMQIYFNEELVLQNPAQVEVILNIKDANGNPITVNGSTVTSLRTGVDARIPVTMLTTERFTIQEGWQPTEPGRAIRAVEIRMPSSATDLCGNAFSNGSTISVGDIPAQQEYLDITAPTFETIWAPDNEDVYTLRTYQDGVSYFAVKVTDKADDRITGDSQAHVSGSDAVGDNPNSTESGSFTLEGTNVSGDSITFEYYVTALSNPTISEDSWKTGYAGTAIRFTQVQDGTYIFIRPAPGQEYIQLHDPVLTVQGFDYAGNKAEATYKLSQPDLFRDNTPPTGGANVVMAAENGRVGFTANMEARDIGGLRQIAYKLECVESTDGTEPEYTAPTEPGSEEEGWKYIDLSSVGSEHSFRAEPVWVDGRNLYYAYLTLYVQDTDGNEFTQTYKGSADWRSGAFSIDVPTGLSEEPISISRLDKTFAAQVGAKNRVITYFDNTEANLDTSWSEETYGSLYVYIEPQRELFVKETLRPMLLVIDDLVEDADGNIVSREGVVGGAENESIADLFASLDTINTSPWISSVESQMTPNQLYFRGMLANFSSEWDIWTDNNQIVTKDDAGNITGFSIGNSSEYYYTPISNFHASYPTWAQGLAGTYQEYYGDLKLYTINAPLVHFNATRGDIDGTDEKAFTYSVEPDPYYPWDVQEYTIKRAYVAEGDTNPVHAVKTGTPFLNDGTDMVLGDDGKYYKADQTTLHTLSGVRIPFDISNVRAADWGLEDLDFEKSYMQFYVGGEPYGDQIPLAANSAGQVFSFPDDLIYDCTSTYDVKVTLTAKTSGHTDAYSIMQPIMFCTTTADPYFSSLSLQNTPGYIEIEIYEDGDIDALVLHEEMIGNNPGEYNIGIDVEGKKNMSGNSAVCPESWEEGGHRSYGEIRVWNAAVPEKQWVIKAAGYSLFFTLVDSAEEIMKLPNDSNFDMIAPLIRGQQNIICVQGSSDYDYKVNGIANYANEPGEVIQIPVTLTNGQLPEVSLQAQPADRTAQSAELTVNINSTYDIKELWYQKGFLEEDEYGFNFSNMVQVTLDEENHLCMAKTGERITLTENGDYTLLAIDTYGGIGIAETTVDNIDSIAPVLSVNKSTAADGSYSLDLTVTEENPDADPSNLTLYLSAENPDEPTASNPEQPDEEDPTVPVTEPFTMIPWSEAPYMSYGNAASETGIYAMEAEYSGDETGHTLHAVIEGAVPETGTMWAWTTDEAGNRSEPKRIFSNKEFAAPKFESVEKDPDGGVILHFTSGVMLMQPTDGTPDTAYGKVKNNVPIYQDGTYTITYCDFFGNSYTEQITVALDGDFSMANVSFSETAPTANDVTVTVTSSDENHLLKMGDCTVTDLTGTSMDTSLYTVTPDADGEGVQILMKENGIINVGMTYGGQTATKAIRVSNIDREVNATLLWSYADGMDHEPGEEVDGAVTVRAVSTDSSETLIGTNGALSYIFAEGSSAGTSYTFEYRDPAGNTGSITAELPVNIKSNIPEPLSFTMEIFLTQRGVLIPAGSYKYSGGDDAYSFDNIPASMENRLNIQTNRSDAEMLILPAGTTADGIDETTQSVEIAGITLSGKSVIITENISFTLAVRSGSEALALPVNVTNIRRLGEVGLIYATLDRYSRRVYFDPKGQSLMLTNQTGIAQEEEHTQYSGYYYHDFTANGSFTFYYEDAAGNTGSITASVWDLVSGNVEPENPALPIRWWPYKILDAEGTSQNQLTDSAVNYDVTAQIKYNMNIAEATLFYNAGSGAPGNPVPLDVASLNVSLDTVNITYHQNADTVLLVTGENGTRHTLPIGAVSIIDKTAPEVAHDYTAGDDKRQSAEITFTPTEEVLCDNIPSAQYYSPENPMKATVTENGTYSYTFRDKAGNQTTLTVEVTDIDTTAPQLQYKLSEYGTEYDSWDALIAENDLTDVMSIYLCADEAAVCQFQGQSIPLNEGKWMMLPINHNGVYGMTVTDSAGNAAVISLYGIPMPDETAPVLWITPSRIAVYVDITADALSDALMEGVSASDKNTAAEEIIITVDSSALEAALASAQKGVYEVSYTAEDRAGNIAAGSRSVTVLGTDDLTLTVNNLLTTPMGTMVLNTGLVDFTVGNLPATGRISEPYSIYVKKGFLTMGQMKNNANKVLNNHTELYGSGYYTVYVVAQNRRQYLTYLYIEQ